MAEGPEDPFFDRKQLTFEQAEGAEPLPAQLKLKELSQEFRARLWNAILYFMDYPGPNVVSSLDERWASIMLRFWVLHAHKPADEFNLARTAQTELLKSRIMNKNYVTVLGTTQWLLRDPRCPKELAPIVRDLLRNCRTAYTLIEDPPTIVPISSEEESAALKRALVDLAAAELRGARAHLRQAAEQLTAGDYAASVRESIHAIESVARVLDPSANTLTPALAKLEKAAGVHPAMRRAFEKLYGYASDQEGIRHALLTDQHAKVDEADALFMIGACASFVSYMLAKARSAGLIEG